MKTKWLNIIAIASILIVPVFASAQICPQLKKYDTNDGAVDHRGPSANGGEVAYFAREDGSDFEIYLWKKRATWPGGPPAHRGEPITDNNYDDIQPSLYGGKIAWLASPDGQDTEVFFFDGSYTKQVTTNSLEESEVSVTGDWIVWITGSGSFSNVQRWNWVTEEFLNVTSDLGIPKRTPFVDLDGNVVWGTLFGGDWEIYFYEEDTGSCANISQAFDIQDMEPRIWNCEVVWEGRKGTNRSQIYQWNCSNVTKIEVTTGISSRNRWPDIHENGEYVWASWIPFTANWEVFHNTRGQITYFHEQDKEPQIEYGAIAWQSRTPVGKFIRMLIGTCPYLKGTPGQLTTDDISLGTNTVAWTEDFHEDGARDLFILK